MGIFHFKQFSVDQSNCAMKVNTDGVLLGALATSNDPARILDIGTGTGLIALMLAQRFPNAKVDAVEIDPQATHTAASNFRNAKFSSRLSVHPDSFQEYFSSNPDTKYDLIVSNPPFFIDSLKSGSPEKERARHADKMFFSDLADGIAKHLTDRGTFWTILPLPAAELIKELMYQRGLEVSNITTVHSFINSEPHRELLEFNRNGASENFEKFVIYYKQKEYSLQYENALKEFLTIF